MQEGKICGGPLGIFRDYWPAGAVPGRGVWGVGVVGCALAAEDHVSLVLEVDARGPRSRGRHHSLPPFPCRRKRITASIPPE